MKKAFYLFLFLCISSLNSACAQSLETSAEQKIETLEKIIKQLENKGLDAYKEKLAIATSKEFLVYADWDERNVVENKVLFEKFKIYKDSAQILAERLPEFERSDINLLLDEVIEDAKRLLKGEITRKPYIRPNWSEIVIKGNELHYKNKPVFLSDYTWKPSTKRLDEYFGELDICLISPSQLKNEAGTLQKNIQAKLENKSSKNAGFVFISHKNVPKWTTKAYGDTFNKIVGKPFTSYDIDNPGARDMMSKLFKVTVPTIANQKFAQFGYMLTNEPRWANYTDGKKRVWFRADVSEYTVNKFKKWLQKRHTTIENVNELWNTNLSNFDKVSTQLPVDIAERGTAKWYDWTTFNQERVTDWFVFLKSEIRKYDPNAKAHLKIMPSIFTENDPDSGIDLETLTELSEINGNDAASHYNNTRDDEAWEAIYAWNWRELYMGYDFLKSVQPNQINFNSESHLLSGSRARDLYMNPKYVRATYWAAHTLGLNVTQTWFWPRREDGSLRPNSGKGYAGSNNQQPRVTFELENTMLDLNRFSEDITLFQQQEKPIRLFYSKTSATQNAEYMDKIFELYGGLNFEGISLGFATKNIINRIDNSAWEVILIHQTTQVTEEEIAALQKYLDNGGTILIDAISLLKNEYGRSITGLKSSKGTLIHVSSLQEMKSKALEIITKKNKNSSLQLIENSGSEAKKCIWREVVNAEGNQVLSIINVGKSAVTLTIQSKKSTEKIVFKNKLNGLLVAEKPILQPFEVLFIEEVKSN
ncbi:hypothetical protein IMCC3317_46460 [Kordia antarctica]|uniref:Glycoside hydrolase family 42 N-terminal domain-containing protein n=1 Tax=Kordia antarctica TaxID=1218801 RepID=A0A7L4ZRV3_9FLAO|nr:beta-galactosidase [Kordia antarctica]QHI39241.1 hypothetical protein IMCC3317_46460 [Kordia antarctica]